MIILILVPRSLHPSFHASLPLFLHSPPLYSTPIPLSLPPRDLFDVIFDNYTQPTHLQF